MTMVTINDGGGSGGSNGGGSSLRCNGGGGGGGGGGAGGSGGGGGGGGDDNCKDEFNNSGSMGNWRRAVGCGLRAAGCWGDDDGDNEVNDRSCDEVHCCSGVKFLQFLMR